MNKKVYPFILTSLMMLSGCNIKLINISSDVQSNSTTLIESSNSLSFGFIYKIASFISKV